MPKTSTARKIGTPNLQPVGSHDAEWKTYVLPRKGMLDLKFTGCLIGSSTNDRIAAKKSVTVDIYMTKGGSFVYYVTHTFNVGDAEKEVDLCTADIFTSMLKLREFILDPTERRYGTATADAWVEACEALNLDDALYTESVE